MVNESDSHRDNLARDRDEAARTRDEQSRNRDELSRDRDAFSQRTTRAARNFQTWAMFVLIVMVAGLFYLIEVRRDALDEIQLSAVRIEEAATHTEEVLVEVVEQGESPDAIAQSQRVREALDDIAVIRGLLCGLPELIDEPACQ